MYGLITRCWWAPYTGRINVKRVGPELFASLLRWQHDLCTHCNVLMLWFKIRDLLLLFKRSAVIQDGRFGIVIQDAYAGRSDSRRRCTAEQSSVCGRKSFARSYRYYSSKYLYHIRCLKVFLARLKFQKVPRPWSSKQMPSHSRRNIVNR